MRLAAAAAFVASAALAAEAVHLASAAASGLGPADGPSSPVAMTPDARYVVFRSSAGDLVAGQGDPGSTMQLYLFDRISKWTVLVSHAVGAPLTPSDGNSMSAFVSADGRYVAFDSSSSDLVEDLVGDGETGVYLWDRVAGATVLVSHAEGSPQSQANDSGQVMGLSADGRWVLYVSNATDAAGIDVDTNGSFRDTLLYDRTDGSTRLVSHVPDDPRTTGNGYGSSAALSADGAWVAFNNQSTDLVDGITDTNVLTDIFLWERAAATATATRLVSRSRLAATTTPNSGSGSLAISADGGQVLFRAFGSDVEGSTVDANGGADLFQFDRDDDVVRLVSRSATSATSTGDGAVADNLAMSADGEYVAYLSLATNVVTGQDDTNAVADAFLWTKSSAASTLVTHQASEPDPTANGATTAVAISTDGNFVGVRTRATDLVTGVTDGNGADDVYLWSRLGAPTRLLSHVQGAPLVTGGNGGATNGPLLGADGGRVAFDSSGDDLVGGDGNETFDVFYFGPEEIFTDGFARGNTTAWTLAVQ